MSQKVLLHAKEIDIILNRLACQLIENHKDFKETCLIGLQPRGIQLTHRLAEILKLETEIDFLEVGKLDLTFYRDDFRRSDKTLTANTTEIDFIVENKNVVFIDDVLYTGRSIRAALTAIQSYGRPKSIELLSLIDRRFSRHLPIQATYKGRKVDAIDDEKVKVHWKEMHGEDAVYLVKN